MYYQNCPTGGQIDRIQNSLCTKAIFVLDIILSYAELDNFSLEELSEYMPAHRAQSSIMTGINYLVNHGILTKSQEQYSLNYQHHVVIMRQAELDHRLSQTGIFQDFFDFKPHK